MGAIGEKILTIIKQIPLLESAFSFPQSVRRRAGREIGFLWFVSSLPLIFSIIAKMITGGSFQDAAAEEVNIKAIFIYTSAFLAPVLYLLIDRLIFPREQKIFAGAYWVFLITLAIAFSSLYLFQNDKIKDSHPWLWASLVMYLLSIYFWWLAIADSRGDISYAEETTQDENDFAVLAAKRRKEKKK